MNVDIFKTLRPDRNLIFQRLPTGGYHVCQGMETENNNLRYKYSKRVHDGSGHWIPIHRKALIMFAVLDHSI